MTREQQRSKATRAKLMKAFRSAFLAQGYANTATQEVLDRAGLSKGALYHHFQGKVDVMAAVYEEESRTSIERALASIDGQASPLRRLYAGILAWTKVVQKKSTAKILFEIGPTALGPQRARAIEDAISIPLISTMLEDAISAREIAPTDVVLTATLLNALVAETALYGIRTGTDASGGLDTALKGILASLRKGSGK